MARAEQGKAGGGPRPLPVPTNASAAAPVHPCRAAAHSGAGARSGAQLVDAGQASAIHFFLAAACTEAARVTFYTTQKHHASVQLSHCCHDGRRPWSSGMPVSEQSETVVLQGYKWLGNKLADAEVRRGTLVVLPETSFFSTALMTPTATVWRMSRTAKRPSGGYDVNGSTHMGLVGTIFTYAASPGSVQSRDVNSLASCIMVGVSTLTLPTLHKIEGGLRYTHICSLCCIWWVMRGSCAGTNQQPGALLR